MPDAAIMKIMINYGIYGAAVCVWFSLLVVEGRGLKSSWICLLLILRQMCLPFVRSLYLLSEKKQKKKKLASKSCYNSWNVHNCRVKGFRIPFLWWSGERERKSEWIRTRACRRCTKTQIHLLCKHLMHHCYVSCCLRMLSSCSMNKRRQGIIMHFLSSPPICLN